MGGDPLAKGDPMKQSYRGFEYTIQPEIRPLTGFTSWIVFEEENSQDEVRIGNGKEVYPTQEAAIEATHRLIDTVIGAGPTP
jgi:hypothetical protein